MTKQALLAAEKIKKSRADFSPKLAIVLGSGLGRLADEVQQASLIPYEDLPGFQKPVVQGHVGQLVLGNLQGLPVVCFQGRAHLYEGTDPQVIRTMIRTARLLGCESLLATNAAGSLHAELAPGSLVVVKDHINLQFSNPLCGSNEDEFGPRFIGLDNAYDSQLREKLFAVAAEEKMALREGVYLAVLGPSFETPAEINAFRLLGADLVGMSTVPEVIVARHCGLRVAVVSVVTNLAAGLHPRPISHEDTLQGAALAIESLTRLVRRFAGSY